MKINVVYMKYCFSLLIIDNINEIRFMLYFLLLDVVEFLGNARKACG